MERDVNQCVATSSSESEQITHCSSYGWSVSTYADTTTCARLPHGETFYSEKTCYPLGVDVVGNR